MFFFGKKKKLKKKTGRRSPESDWPNAAPPLKDPALENRLVARKRVRQQGTEVLDELGGPNRLAVLIRGMLLEDKQKAAKKRKD